MSQTEIMLRDFFHKNPDVRNARSKGLVNRRALARYIMKSENLPSGQLDSVIASLRRFDSRKSDETDFPALFRDITISTKENVVILTLKKSQRVFERLTEVLSCVDYSKGDLLKIAQGTGYMRIFMDESNLKKIKGVFSDKEIVDVRKNLSEIGLLFPDSAADVRGLISYISSSLSVEDVNLVEITTCTPELALYVDEKQMLKAYETLWRIEEAAKLAKK